MQRPLGITVTALLMVGNLVCDVFFALTAPYISNSAIKPTGPSGLMIAFHVVLAAFILVEIVAIPFYWLGKAWARWAVLVGCIYYLYSLRSIVRDWHRRHDIALLGIGAAVLAVYLLWYLHTERVRAWFARPRQTA